MAGTISQLIPLAILFLVLSGGAWIGYQIYISLGKIQETASEKMNRKNVVFTKQGMRVGVKPLKNESYVDTTQKYFVKAWNLGINQEEEEVKPPARKLRKHQS